MLSAFIARPIIELRQRDKSKIESILAYGDRLLVGLNTGSLRVYRVNELPDDNRVQNGSATTDAKSSSRPGSSSVSKLVDLLRELEKFSPRGIEQLAIIKEANILISLSNSFVSIYDLQSYKLQEQLAKTKNATTFAVTSNIVSDPATGIPEIISRLAVAVKRKLILWSWHESELLSEMTEVTIAAPIRTLTWASASTIICGMNSGYVLVDVLTSEVKDIVGPGAIGGAAAVDSGRFGGVGSVSMGYMGLGGYVPKPLITRLGDGEGDGELLLAKDINSLFINAMGEPLEKRQIPWQQAPESIGYSYPYLLSLQPASKGALEVRNPKTLTLLQTVPLPNANVLHFPPPTVSLAHAGKGFHVASDRGVWRMEATDYDAQIDELVDGGHYDEAISLLDMLEDALLHNKSERRKEVQMLKAQLFFDQRKYQDALDLFADIKAPPERVIRLYPKVIAGDLSMIDGKCSQNGGNHGEETKTNGHVELHVPEEDAAAETIIGSPKPAVLHKLLRGHKKAISDTGSVRSLKKDADSSDTASIAPKAAEDGPLEGKDLTSAVRALNGFLVETRARRVLPYLDPVTGRLKQITEDKERQASEQLDTLFMSTSSMTEESREENLVRIAKLVDTTLFKAYMLVLPTLAGSLFRIPNFCDPDVVNEKLLENNGYNDLVDFFHGKKLHRPALDLLKKFGQAEQVDEAAPTLHGPRRTVGYLQNLPPEMIDLILEFAEWPLRANPELGMEIFLADTENAENLPRETIVQYLEGIDVDLAVRYLEHITDELNDLTPDFHNRLVSAYIRDLKEKSSHRDDAWRKLMERLLSFLRSSKQYSLSKAFGMIPRDDTDFYEAQAVVLSNMGQHKQALEIYVFKLQDFEKAEEYCNHVHFNEASPTSSPIQSRRAFTSDPNDGFPSIYHTLLSLYLTPPAPHHPNWAPALSLLSNHGSRLPAASTLNLIPATLPVAELESYFRGRIRAANSIVNQSRVVAGLSKTEVVAAQALLLLGSGVPGEKGGHNRRVVVSEDRVCGVCHKRIGGSVIAVLSDNAVVHYGCLNRVGGAGKVANSTGGGASRWG